MSLIKLAATKWKTMISSLSDNSVKRLSNLIPDKKKYIQGLETGLVNRTKALEQQRGINIITRYKNSRTINLAKDLGIKDTEIDKVKVPLPNSTIPLDGRNYYVIGPRSHRSNVWSMLGGKEKFSNNDSKIINLHARNHELTEVSRIDKIIKKKSEINIDPNIINKIKKRGLHRVSENDLSQLNPHLLEPKFHSHIDKKVLNTDRNFINKTPYPKISRFIKEFRENEKEHVDLAF